MATLMQLDKLKYIQYEISTDSSMLNNASQPKSRYSELARDALRQLIKKEDSIEEIELEIESHLHLKKNPQLLVSLSHTKAIGAACICHNRYAQSIGLDIEWSERIIKPGIEKFYLNDNDDLISHTKLDLWMIKEAAFKAISPIYEKSKNLEDKPLVLKDIIVKNNQFSTKIASLEYMGHYQLETKLVLNRKLRISLALI